MNTWRVDRADSRVVPCGMNSIQYIGDSERKAIEWYNNCSTGLDPWSMRNDSYGVLLSKWDAAKNDYVVVRAKGLP